MTGLGAHSVSPERPLDLAALADTLRSLLGPGIGVGVTDPTAPGGTLLDTETPTIARAVAKRRLEFTAGRIAARAAMADLGLPPAPVPMGPDRAPIWPEGLTGSIAHCATACIAAVTPLSAVRSIGLDIEEATPLAPDLWDTICTPVERTWLATRPEADRGLQAKRIFSAKEALYKAQYPLTRRLLEFREVEVFHESGAFRGQFARNHSPSLEACKFRIASRIVGNYLISALTIKAGLAELMAKSFPPSS